MRNYPRWSRWRSCGDNKTTSQPARELLDAVWEAAERGPYPLIHADAFNVLGQIELDEGKKDAAIEAAKKAYRLAWCDGPPFAYHWGLEKAKQHLKELRSIRGMSFMWMRNRLIERVRAGMRAYLIWSAPTRRRFVFRPQNKAVTSHRTPNWGATLRSTRLTSITPTKYQSFTFVNSHLKGRFMKRVSLLFMVGMLFIAGTVWAKTIRVKFPPGRTTVVLKGRTTGGPSESGGMDPITYRLRAIKGQTMTLHLTSAKKNAVFGVWAPGMDPMDVGQNSKDWSGALPKTGDYEIAVWPDDEKTNTTFTLEITVR